MSAGFDTVTVIGAGLLGASLGLALKQRGLVGTVLGVGHRRVSIDRAIEVGAIDEGFLEPEAACERADLVVVCTPAAAVTGMLDRVRDVCSPKAVLTDVASTKATICAHARDTWPAPRRFVGSHPMAGSEKFGPEHARADLYQGSITLMETRTGHAEDAWQTVADLWGLVGSRVVEIEPEAHDAAVARTSHIPHIEAACLALLAAQGGDVQPFIGNGFRDATRIAAGRWEVWRDICLTNRETIVAGLDDLLAQMERVRGWVADGDGEGLRTFFQAARDARAELAGE